MADQDDLSVYAIWGMGGIGKTTLAQLVYNDVRVKKHFELRIWVSVSDDFSLQRLVRAMLESVQGGGSSGTELDPLLRLLQEKLRGKKFLLVLDDVWNENQSLWDPLKEALRCGSKGCAVMVTTRNEKIALMMAATITPHRIGYLSDADSWSLFRRRAFAGRTEEEKLVEIVKAIVKKCDGLPLAIKAIEIYEDIGRQSLNNNLLKYGVKGHLLNAGICQLCKGDVVAINNALERYQDLDPTFSGTREYRLLADLAAALDEEDVEKFTSTGAIKEFDSMTRLDAWKTTLLLRVREAVKAKVLVLGLS